MKLEEIEGVIAEVTGATCFVDLVQGSLVCAIEDGLDLNALSTLLLDRLPSHLHPRRVLTRRLHRTTSGKIDVSACAEDLRRGE